MGPIGGVQRLCVSNRSLRTNAGSSHLPSLGAWATPWCVRLVLRGSAEEPPVEQPVCPCRAWRTAPEVGHPPCWGHEQVNPRGCFCPTPTQAQPRASSLEAVLLV